MATQAQILANQRNAQRSTGPRTHQGKAVIAQNALKHGVTTAHPVISLESQDEFDIYRQQLLEELAPASPMESMLTERIISLSWRLKRASLIQNQTIDALNKPDSSPLKKLTQSILLKDRPQPDQPDPELILGRLAIKDFSHAGVLDKLLMYERRIEHSL